MWWLWQFLFKNSLLCSHYTCHQKNIVIVICFNRITAMHFTRKGLKGEKLSIYRSGRTNRKRSTFFAEVFCAFKKQSRLAAPQRKFILSTTRIRTKLKEMKCFFSKQYIRYFAHWQGWVTNRNGLNWDPCLHYCSPTSVKLCNNVQKTRGDQSIYSSVFVGTE